MHVKMVRKILYQCILFELILLSAFITVSATTSPTPTSTISYPDGCDSSTTGAICINCVTTYNCTHNIAAQCATDNICDNEIAEGVCIPLTSPSFSPICMCHTSGCFEDPNNSDYHINCLTSNTDEPVTVSQVQKCNASTIMDTSVCECKIPFCPDPECDWITTDDSDCPTQYYNCADPEDSHIFNCPDYQCFKADECRCVEQDCPSCGKYAEPNVPDGSSYCICGDTIDTTCGLTCGIGYVFEDKYCDCIDPLNPPPTIYPTPNTKTTLTPNTANSMSPNTKTTPTPNTANSITPNTKTTLTPNPLKTTTNPSSQLVDCNSCDQAPDTESGSCDLYFWCYQNGTIRGTYRCPGNQCYHEETCSCY